MNFFEMDSVYYNRYMAVTNDFMQKNGLKNQGVLYVSLEKLPEIDKRLKNLEKVEVLLTNDEIQKIIDEYNKLNEVYEARFEQIFERCVGDVTIEEDFNIALGSSPEWVVAITGVSEEDFEKLYNLTEGKSFSESAKIYGETIKAYEDESIAKVIETIYQKSYS